MELNAEQIRYKMSEKQIKTALECLSKPNSSPADREKCYFMWKEPSCFSCYHEVAQNALALITSQEQRIKELTEELDDAKRDTIPKLRLSLERANVMGVEADKKVAELTEENERLRAICDMKECVIENAEAVIARTKTETVRQMQELIYERLDISVEGYSSEEIKSDVRDMVYQIAKEMLEGEK